MRKIYKLLILLGLFCWLFPCLTANRAYADMAAPYTFDSDPNYSEEVFNNPTRLKMTPLSQYTINDEVYLYKGPNEKYGKNDDEYHLPAGIVITSTYYDDLWMYVEYEGHTGWIYYYHVFSKEMPNTASVASNDYNGSFISNLNQIELKDYPSKDAETIATFNVTPLTEIPVLYYFSTSRTASWVFISYGEYSGWFLKDIANYQVAFRKTENQSCITVKEITATNTVDSTTTSFTIPVGTKLTATYYSMNDPYETNRKEYINYVLDNGSTFSGWIDSDSVAFSTLSDGKYTEKTLDQDRPIFSTVNGTKTGESAKSGTYNVLYYYVVSNDNVEENETWYYLGKNSSASYGQEEIGWINDFATSEIAALEEQKQAEVKGIVNEEPKRTQTFVEEEYVNPEDEIFSTTVWLLIGFGLLSITIIIVLVVQKKHRTIEPPALEIPKPEQKLDPEEPKDA